MGDNFGYQLALFLVILGGVFDYLDGYLAGLINAKSKIGIHLDSLSDLITFSLAPAFLVYDFFQSQLDKLDFLPLISLLIIPFSMIRLARFNSELSERPSYAKNYFTGVPTPAAAFLMLFPIAIDGYLESQNLKSFEIIGLWIGLISIVMVSNLPTFSGKVFQIPKSFVIPMLIILALLSNAIISNPIKGFIILVLVYILSLPFASLFYWRLKKKAEALNLKS